jgi:hypothetical protein
MVDRARELRAEIGGPKAGSSDDAEVVVSVGQSQRDAHPQAFLQKARVMSPVCSRVTAPDGSTR